MSFYKSSSLKNKNLEDVLIKIFNLKEFSDDQWNVFFKKYN